MVKGIDAYNMGVRDANGNIVHTPIDWAKVKQTANGAFTMLKATLGTEMDWSFLANYAECKRVGMPIGTYHWLYANTVAKAHQEAQYFINAVKGKQFEYPIMLDIEDDPDCPTLGCLDKELLTDIVIAWLTDVQNAGYYVMWYANSDWRKNHLNTARLAAFDSMLACYDGNTPETTDYSKDCGIWQYSSKGVLEGISNHYVDLDVAYKDYPTIIKSASLNGWGKSVPVVAPALTPKPAPAPVVQNPFAKGDKVKVTNAVDCDGATITLYYSQYDVIQTSCSKVLVGVGSTPTAWFDSSHLSKSGAAAPASAPAYRTYTTVPGDSLWAIASRLLGDGSRYPEIKRLNGLTSDTIGIGKTLKIPNR